MRWRVHSLGLESCQLASGGCETGRMFGLASFVHCSTLSMALRSGITELYSMPSMLGTEIAMILTTVPLMHVCKGMSFRCYQLNMDSKLKLRFELIAVWRATRSRRCHDFKSSADYRQRRRRTFVGSVADFLFVPWLHPPIRLCRILIVNGLMFMISTGGVVTISYFNKATLSALIFSLF